MSVVSSQIASLRSLSFSRWAHAFSGIREGPVRPHPSRLCVRLAEAYGVFSRTTFLAKGHKCELIAMRVSHVEKLTVQSKS